MHHTYFRRLLAITLVLGFAGAAHAQDGDQAGEAKAVTISPAAMARALATERRPPQAPPVDPSKDLSRLPPAFDRSARPWEDSWAT
jgi:hypothetical protein